jgi:hypothetical protein
MAYDNGWIELGEPDIGVFPYDGSAVWVTEDGKTQHPAVWKSTRSYDSINSRWVENYFWAKHNAGGQRVDIVPVAYKRMAV